MSFSSNTDNQHLETKVALRARVLKEAGLERLRVLDLFAGYGFVWRETGKQFPIASYLPVDKDPKMPGTIKAQVTPRFLRGLDLSRFNVIDVDCYGEPWELWLNIAPRITTRTAVFLTHGYMTVGKCQVSAALREAAGIPVDWKIPMKQELALFLGDMALRDGAAKCRVLHAEQVKMKQKVSYYGLVCESNRAQVISPAG